VGEFIVPALAELGLGLEDLDLLLITHSDLDHQGGTHGLRQGNSSLWVGCGVLDLALVSDPSILVSGRYLAYRDEHGLEPSEQAVAWMLAESGQAERVDIGLRGGELLELAPGWNLRILHVPGHSPGHLAVLDERSGALFSGDCLQGSVYLGLDGTPKLCPTYTHIDPYLATAALVESLAPSELHGCHWPPQRGTDVFSFIGETRDYVRHIDRAVQAGLKEPRTLADLIEQVNLQLDHPWPDDLAGELVYSVHGHAEWLVARGLAARQWDGERPVVYRRTK
jgi:glyoxylase-like metal-dependent hydrolase (beta-lactamase superfamily II)